MPAEPLWIAFDAVGTLLFADPPVHLAYYRIGRKHGSQARPEEVLHRYRRAFAERSAADPHDIGTSISTTAELAAHDGEERERRFWRSVVTEVLPDVRDADACFEELFAHFARPTSWGLFADVEETFEEAQRRGHRLAIASNFDARLHPLCDGHAPLALIEQRVISSEVGARKPQAEFFHALLRACDCTPEQMLFVGDDFENDVAAPCRLGIRAVHLDRTGAAAHSIRALTDLWAS